MSMQKGFKFPIKLCDCGKAVAENYMVTHIKSGHKLPRTEYDLTSEGWKRRNQDYNLRSPLKRLDNLRSIG